MRIADRPALDVEGHLPECGRDIGLQGQARQPAIDYPAFLDICFRDREITAHDVGTDHRIVLRRESNAAQIEGIADVALPVQLAGLEVPAAHLRRFTAGYRQPFAVAGETQMPRLARGRPALAHLAGGPIEADYFILPGESGVKAVAVAREHQAARKGADRHF